MFGGLYGDLPPPSSKDEDVTGSVPSTTSASVWSNSTAKMAPTALRKPSTLFSPQSILRTTASNKPRPQPQPLLQPQPRASTSPPAHHDPHQHHAALAAVTSTVAEEYDPARPNDYEDYRREKRRRQVEAEMRRRREQEEAEEQQQQQQAAIAISNDEDSLPRHQQPPPPPLNISGEEAWRRRQAMSTPVTARSPSPPPTESVGGKSGGGGGLMTAAQRMMAKMGWKEGQGLGKQEQGITTPLMAKKTDRRAGVIVNASADRTGTESNKKVKSANITSPPTKVLLLRNMVGPGEVDDDLEEEVASECAKYGTVTRVLIFEITEPDFPVEEAVRIFVQFERSEQTTKALIDLDGRYFGGRIVCASFYDEDRFSKNELAPGPGEIPGYT